MKEFYKNVTAMSKVDALRKAQETLSHNPKYVHPFFWGAFVLYGDWR
jgi:CHAT domain-containing protein